MLSAEPLIMAWLAEQTGEKVFSAADLAGIAEDKQVAPAFQLLYGGYQVVDAESVTTVQIRETWVPIAVVKNAIQGQGTGKANEAMKARASQMVTRAASVLVGWRPSQRHSELMMVPAPKPVFSKAFGYFPLAFTTDLFIKKGQ